MEETDKRFMKLKLPQQKVIKCLVFSLECKESIVQAKPEMSIMSPNRQSISKEVQLQSISSLNFFFTTEMLTLEKLNVCVFH